MAQAADSEYGQDENGKTQYDHVADAAVAADEWISGPTNYETGEQSHWARRALGTTAGIGISAIGGVHAGINGAGDALVNWATDW